MSKFFSVIVGLPIDGDKFLTVAFKHFPELESNEETKTMVQTDVGIVRSYFSGKTSFQYGDKSVDPNAYSDVRYQLYRVVIAGDGRNQNILVKTTNVKKPNLLSELLFSY